MCVCVLVLALAILISHDGVFALAGCVCTALITHNTGEEHTVEDSKRSGSAVHCGAVVVV